MAGCVWWGDDSYDDGNNVCVRDGTNGWQVCVCVCGVCLCVCVMVSVVWRICDCDGAVTVCGMYVSMGSE